MKVLICALLLVALLGANGCIPIPVPWGGHGGDRHESERHEGGGGGGGHESHESHR